MPDTETSYSSGNDTSSQPPIIPQFIGRFHIDGIYSQGGMSTIYLATDPVTHDQIVVKVLLPRFVSDASLVQQFVNEGRIIALTDHPNIVKLYEYGEWAGGVYIAMELVRGTSLRRILQHNPLPLKRALEVLLQVCYAISHLHSHGVIHGDLKPENILITDQNQVKLIDFGISRLVSEGGEIESAKSKRFIGTPIYMSPEAQKNPRNSSIQSDIYSIGIIAYELVMGKITHGRVILTLAPRGLQPILQTALQPKPEDRYHDISELITAISEYIHSGSLQKDRQGVDYFFELFSQLEFLQKSLLASLVPQNDPNVGVTTSYGVGLNALYFQYFEYGSEKVVLLAKGDNRGVQGIIDTYCLHTLFDVLRSQNPTLGPSDLILLLFQKSAEQGLPFLYSFLTVNPHTRQFTWRQEGWGTLFITTETITRHIQIKPGEQAVFEGSFSPKDRFCVIGTASSTLLEFASTPMVPLNIMLIDAIHATRHLPCEKQTNAILQKLRMRGDCIIDDYPACLVSLNALEG
jgi:eukaryotic-like serine/threonine-protein kinase